MYKEKMIVLDTEFYKIVSAIIGMDDLTKLLTKEWNVYPKYKNRKKLQLPVQTQQVPDEHEELQRELVGVFKFSDEPVDGRLSLSYEKKAELKPEFFVELVKILCEWAFSLANVYSIKMDLMTTEINDELEKNLFVKEDDALVLHKEEESYLATGLCVGLALGLCVGGCFDNISLGMGLGIAVGVAVGAHLDKREKTHRRTVEKQFYKDALKK